MLWTMYAARSLIVHSFLIKSLSRSLSRLHSVAGDGGACAGESETGSLLTLVQHQRGQKAAELPVGRSPLHDWDRWRNFFEGPLMGGAFEGWGH